MARNRLRAEDYNLSAQAPYYYQHVINRPLSMEDHEHDFFEIYVIIKGTVKQVVGGEVYLQGPGDLVLILPEEQHNILQWSDEFELICLSVFTPELNQFLEIYGLKEWIEGASRRQITLDSRQIHELCMLFRRILVMAHTRIVDCGRIMVGIMMHEFIKSMFSNTDEWMTQILEQMSKEENLVDGVPALLRLSHFSHAQLCRVIKQQLNMTPQQYVISLRMNYAYDMIQGTDVDIQDIAMRVGYSSFSHFSVTFKEKFGISPAQLRRNSRILHM